MKIPYLVKALFKKLPLPTSWRKRAYVWRRSLLYIYYDLCARHKQCPGTLPSESRRNPPLVISLTTIPSRVSRVHLVIESLLQQSLKPDRLELWLAHEDFASLEALPAAVLRLEKRGLKIRFCDNLRSYKKFVPTMKESPGAIIVTSDDDILYPSSWLKELYQSYLNQPQHIHCQRAHRVLRDDSGQFKPYRDWEWRSPTTLGPSLDLFATTGHGMLIPPGLLSSEAINESVFMSLCPQADDVWIFAMARLHGLKVAKVDSHPRDLHPVFPEGEGLYCSNWLEDGNDKQLAAVFAHYGLKP